MLENTVIIIGGANIDQKENPNQPGDFGKPLLGGDAANSAYRLGIAHKHGWGRIKPTLAAMVGLLAKPGGYGGHFILSELAEARVTHDESFQLPNWLVRNAIWEWKKDLGKHELQELPKDPAGIEKSKTDPQMNYLSEPADHIKNVAPHAEIKSGIVLAASMAATLAWKEYGGHYLKNVLPNDAILITSPNTRKIEMGEKHHYDGQDYDKHDFYWERLGEQLARTNILVIGSDDLKYLFPYDLYPEFYLDGSEKPIDPKLALTDLMDEIGNVPIIFTKGKDGLVIYPSFYEAEIEIPANPINDAPDTVGAGGAALTGLVLALTKLGIQQRAQCKTISREQWQEVGRTMTAFSEYQIRLNNGEQPAFPRPATGGNPGPGPTRAP